MVLELIEFDLKAWSLNIWFKTGFLQIHVCRSWDGRFIVDSDKKVLPRYGFRKEHIESLMKDTPLEQVLKTAKGWRLWIPYIMLWKMKNVLEETTIFVDKGEDNVL